MRAWVDQTGRDASAFDQVCALALLDLLQQLLHSIKLSDLLLQHSSDAHGQMSANVQKQRFWGGIRSGADAFQEVRIRKPSPIGAPQPSDCICLVSPLAADAHGPGENAYPLPVTQGGGGNATLIR